MGNIQQDTISIGQVPIIFVQTPDYRQNPQFYPLKT